MNNLKIVHWVAVIWTLIILAGCLTPHDQVPYSLTTWNDKFQYIILFILFGVLLRGANLPMNTVILAGVFLGGLIEILQYMPPLNRSADWGDFTADFVGVILGLILTLVVRRFMKIYQH